MDRLDVTAVADAVNGGTTPADAWRRFSAVLAGHGLTRTALHAGLPLAADNPFAYDRCERAFGLLWDRDLDERMRGYAGDVHRSRDPLLCGLRPMLIFLSMFAAPLFVNHRALMSSEHATELAPISRIMVERLGQYQTLVLPLTNPRTGTAAILSAWGEEDRPDFARFVTENLTALHMAGHFLLAMIEQRWPDPRVMQPQTALEIATPLSDRERQVLALFADGAQTAEVADRLGISERSVREYVARARTKLDARSRSAAVAKAVQAGHIG